MKTILEICREVADLAAVKRPNDLFNMASQQESIFLSVAKSTLDSLLRYGDWQELIRDGCLHISPGCQQYMISECIPDFFSIVNNTIYIKDGQEKIIGAITPEQWMRDKYFCSTGSGIKFRIQNGRFVFLNQPQKCMNIVFQYRSNNVVWDFKTFEEKDVLSSNSYVPIFDEYLVKLGILWRWLKRSGLDYSEEYNEYERELKKRFGSSIANKDIVLAGINNPEEGVMRNEVKINCTGK